MNKYFGTAEPEALSINSMEGVTLSFKQAMTEYIKAHKPSGPDLVVQLAGDGANAFRGVSQTTVAFKVVTKGAEHDTEFRRLNSPFTSQSVLVFEGKEAYQEVKDALERLLQELDNIKIQGIQVDDTVYVLKIKGGGDMKWINMMLGLATCSHTYCCSYCEGAKDELHEKKEFKLRTTTTLLEGAHLYHPGMMFPWQCPYCSKCFQTKEEMQNEPAPTSEKKRLEFQLLHKGVMFHRGPILDIAPEDYVADVLHFALREVTHAIEITCRRRCTTQDQVDKLAKYLQQHVKCFIKLRKVKKKTGVTEEKTPNVIGRECALTMQHSEGMVRTVLSASDPRFQKAMKFWRTLKLLWQEMTTRLVLDTPEHRVRKARQPMGFQ
ncbi:hypothetical protein CYMTET_36855 [Cymbomonas tetramitiformis]|uniref:Uncharacterized protein n=1 Tax=Cymbomonas tetramitiformis TaxID=36881 RepID=A0AAE0F7R6_9CHLO|nr:hypothetical protein CYMTET_36855 [Cymbomonas tetramitiformis]